MILNIGITCKFYLARKVLRLLERRRKFMNGYQQRWRIKTKYEIEIKLKGVHSEHWKHPTNGHLKLNYLMKTLFTVLGDFLSKTYNKRFFVWMDLCRFLKKKAYFSQNKIFRGRLTETIWEFIFLRSNIPKNYWK